MRHIVKSFDRDLSQLDDHGRQDGAPGSQEDTVGAMRNAIHRYAVRLLALRTPFAGDLRQVVSALLISSDLERIAGHLKNIAERTVDVNKAEPVERTIEPRPSSTTSRATRRTRTCRNPVGPRHRPSRRRPSAGRRLDPASGRYSGRS